MCRSGYRLLFCYDEGMSQELSCTVKAKAFESTYLIKRDSSAKGH